MEAADVDEYEYAPREDYKQTQGTVPPLKMRPQTAPARRAQSSGRHSDRGPQPVTSSQQLTGITFDRYRGTIGNQRWAKRSKPSTRLQHTLLVDARGNESSHNVLRNGTTNVNLHVFDDEAEEAQEAEEEGAPRERRRPATARRYEEPSSLHRTVMDPQKMNLTLLHSMYGPRTRAKPQARTGLFRPLEERTASRVHKAWRGPFPQDCGREECNEMFMEEAERAGFRTRAPKDVPRHPTKKLYYSYYEGRQQTLMRQSGGRGGFALSGYERAGTEAKLPVAVHPTRTWRHTGSAQQDRVIY